jgi:hypothetical protein
MRVPAFLTAILTAVGGSAWAEAAPKASVDVEPKYQSSFVDYRGFKDEPVKPWRESNEAMQGLGGHMGHLNNATENSDTKPTGREPPADDKIPDGSKP